MKIYLNEGKHYRRLNKGEWIKEGDFCCYKGGKANSWIPTSARDQVREKEFMWFYRKVKVYGCRHLKNKKFRRLNPNEIVKTGDFCNSKTNPANSGFLSVNGLRHLVGWKAKQKYLYFYREITPIKSSPKRDIYIRPGFKSRFRRLSEGEIIRGDDYANAMSNPLYSGWKLCRGAKFVGLKVDNSAGLFFYRRIH